MQSKVVAALTACNRQLSAGWKPSLLPRPVVRQVCQDIKDDCACSLVLPVCGGTEDAQRGTGHRAALRNWGLGNELLAPKC